MACRFFPIPQQMERGAEAQHRSCGLTNANSATMMRLHTTRVVTAHHATAHSNAPNAKIVGLHVLVFRSFPSRRGTHPVMLLTNQQSSSSAAGRHARPTAPGNDAPASRIHHGSLAVVPQLQADTAAGWPRQRNHRQQPVVSVFHCSSTATSGGNQMPAAVVRHELVRLSPALISAGHSSRLLRQLDVTYVMSRYI